MGNLMKMGYQAYLARMNKAVNKKAKQNGKKQSGKRK